MKEIQIDPGADTIQFIGDAALDAAGLGFAAPLWDCFFPQGEVLFSKAQLDQLTALFQQLFTQQYYLENMNLFISSTTLCNEYANDPVEGQLANILTQTENGALGLLSNGYTTARVYLSSALLHILALKFALEAASEQDKAGAQKNIAQAALDILTNLLTLEQSYGEAEGWQEYAAFKQATVLANGSLSPTAITAFGADYIQQVQGLMGLVNLYDSARMNEITHPPYMMLFTPYDPASTPITWSCYGNNYETTAYIYKCQGLPPGVPSNYYPLSDLATISVINQGTPVPPQYVIYVASNASPLISPTSYQQIYNDHGSGLPTDYAGFWTTPLGIGSYSAGDDNANQPDNANLCQLIDSSFYAPVELPTCLWDDKLSGADEDGEIYLHPQFGDFGVYLIERSHSRPDPDTVNGLSTLALSGHGQYKTSKLDTSSLLIKDSLFIS